jgi:MoxR-like ATPase
MSDMQVKVGGLVDALNETIINRNEEVKAAVACLLSKNSMFLLGVPGVAKSLLIQNILKAIPDAKGFIWLLSQTTDIQEVVGNVSLKALREEDKFKYNVAGKLPTADIAFLDEIFKANSGLLNALLTLLNERAFDNADERIEVPLISCFAASNELPQDDSLKALYDRFLVRRRVTDINQDEDFKSLLQFSPPDHRSLMTLDDLKVAQEESRSLPIDPEFYDTMLNLWKYLTVRAPHLQMSARRWRQSVGYIQARAYVAGMTSVNSDCIVFLRDVMWNDPSQIGEVSSALSANASQVVATAEQCFNEAVALMNATITNSSMDNIADIKNKIDLLKTRIDTLIESCPEKKEFCLEARSYLAKANANLVKKIRGR